jgi:mannose-6-phosphate isomerase-like protein (cupin superfamily)
MSDYAIKRIDDMEAAFRGGFKKARAELGVSSFGIQVLEFPPNADQYPEHDHAEEGQEEVFVLLRGGGSIEIDGERHELDPDTLVRLGPGVKRKLVSGPEGMRVLALGGVPGQAYEIKQYTELGEPDPMGA